MSEIDPVGIILLDSMISYTIAIQQIQGGRVLKFAKYVTMNHVIYKGNPQFKLSYNIFKGKYRYDTLIEISPFPTLIQLKEFLGGIHHCVTVVGKWISDSDFTFVIRLTHDELH